MYINNVYTRLVDNKRFEWDQRFIDDIKVGTFFLYKYHVIFTI